VVDVQAAQKEKIHKKQILISAIKNKAAAFAIMRIKFEGDLMKNVYIALVVVVGFFSANSNSGQLEKLGVPKNMRTGRVGQPVDPRAIFRNVMRELEMSNGAQQERMAARAAAQMLESLQRLLPSWAFLIPESVLLYVGFNAQDTYQERARKFMRMALLVRDMYLDYPLNHNTLQTLTVGAPRLPDPVRLRLVSMCFLEAYTWLARLRSELLEENEELILAMTDIANWTIHSLHVAGGETSVEMFLAAVHIYNFATTAIQAAPVQQTNKLQQLIERSRQIFVRAVGSFLMFAVFAAQIKIQQK
jgi:hypothetical protein